MSLSFFHCCISPTVSCLGQRLLLCILVTWDIAGPRFRWKTTYSVENNSYVDRLKYDLDISLLMKEPIDSSLLFISQKKITSYGLSIQ